MPMKMKIINLMIEKVIDVKQGEDFLVVSDDYARSKFIAESALEAAASRGANTSWAVMTPLTHIAQEPPRPIAAAMKATDKMLVVFDTYGLAHSTARKMATEAGARYYGLNSFIPERFLNTDISFKDLEKLRENTEEIARRLTEAKEARITSVHGTDVTMSLEGRKGIPIHPLSAAPIIVLPDYGEATIAIVEGTSEGTLVVDSSVQGWHYFLREPLRLKLNKGRIVDIEGNPKEVERLERAITKDENANNVAELGIGTCHFVPEPILGWDAEFGALGYVHIGVGRNYDFGGETWSRFHNDLCMTQTKIELDGICILEKNVLKI